MLSIKSLSKAFKEKPVLKDVSFEVKKGEVVGIIGPSGSGKSTLLRSLNRLEVPTSGTISFKSDEINDKNIRLFRQKIGMIFQHFNLFPHLTVLENVSYAPIKVKKISKKEAIKKAKNILTKVGLGDKFDAYPAQLSGGQKQRVAIARTLAMDVEVLLCDEPTSALDPEMVKEVLSVLKDLAKSGMTILIVTHEMGFVEQVASRIIFMDEGKKCHDESVKDFFSKSKQSTRVKDFLSHF